LVGRELSSEEPASARYVPFRFSGASYVRRSLDDLFQMSFPFISDVGLIPQHFFSAFSPMIRRFLCLLKRQWQLLRSFPMFDLSFTLVPSPDVGRAS